MHYLELLKHNQLKVTPQRSVILEQINHFGHIDIDTLFIYVKKQFPNISLATLYKNINAMLEKTILKEVKISGMKTKYELSKKEHIHTVCDQCENIEDVFLDTHAINSLLEKENSFRITHSDINFFGTCKRCQAT